MKVYIKKIWLEPIYVQQSRSRNIFMLIIRELVATIIKTHEEKIEIPTFRSKTTAGCHTHISICSRITRAGIPETSSCLS